jgi:DNA polymerase
LIQTEINIDFETFSKVDLSKEGLHRYACHHSTEVLMAAWSVNSGEVKQWVPAEGEPMPKELEDLLLDPNVLKRAHNAPFEMAIIKHCLKMPVRPEEWRCTMALALSLALPASLEKLGEAVSLSEELAKDSRGKSLIRKFCVPRKPTINLRHTRANHFTDCDDWQDFKHYNRQDVVAELSILQKIKKWDLSEEERSYWALDWEINNRGLPINLEAVDNAIEMVEAHFEKKYRQMKLITQLDNPMSVQQLLEWLNERGYKYTDLKSGHVKKAWGDLVPKNEEELQVKEVLECRMELSKSSVKKYFSVRQTVSSDSRLRNCFQYCGASRTGRFGGRNFQPQNLAKASSKWEKHQEQMSKDLQFMTLEEAEEKYKNATELLSGALRTIVQAPEGEMLVDADLSAIENRVIGWVCDDRKILSVFEKGRDPYIDFAQYLFGKTYDEIFAEVEKGNKKMRTIAKPAVLGAGYGLGVGTEREDSYTGEITSTGLLGYARGMGIDMTREEAQHSIDVFRNVYSDVVAYWKVIERAAINCVNTGKETRAGKIVFKMEKPFLRMYLPSGRALSYFKPKVSEKPTPWGEMRKQLSYLNVVNSGQMMYTSTYGGKLVENAVQAIARDLLLHGMKLAEEKGLEIFMHVHDQIVCSVKEEKAEKALKTLVQCMETPPSWGLDIPLGAEGQITKCFMK